MWRTKSNKSSSACIYDFIKACYKDLCKSIDSGYIAFQFKTLKIINSNGFSVEELNQIQKDMFDRKENVSEVTMNTIAAQHWKYTAIVYKVESKEKKDDAGNVINKWTYSAEDEYCIRKNKIFLF